MNKKLLCFLGIAVFLGILWFLPVPEGLSKEGYHSILVMMATVLFWVTEAMPLVFTAVFFIYFPSVIDLVPLPKMMSNFATPVLFFAFSMFIMSTAFYNSGLSRRIVLLSSIKSKGNPDKLLLYLMLASGLLSCFFADVPVMAVMVPIALVILQNNKCEERKSSFGRAVMIGLPFACLIGGVGTPMGSATNLLVMNMLKDIVHIEISFLEWSCLGMPLVWILIPASWYILVKVYRPEMTQLIGMEGVEEEYRALGALTANEKKFLFILGLNIAFWMADTIHHIPLPVAAVMGATLFLIPGINLIDWSKDHVRIGWEIIIMTGAANALGVMLWEQGSAAWIATTCLQGISSMPLWLIIAIISAFTVVVHLLVPVNIAIVAVLLPTSVALAEAMGINAAILAIPMGFSVSAALLLPLDLVSLISYNSGYYKMTDMFKPGTLVSIVWVVVIPILMLTIGNLLNLL